MGGTQSLHTNSMDEALALPTERAVQVALRTQQIIAHESGVADTIDPLAGSYVIEHLTDEIEKQAAGYIQKIDDLGGALAATERGYIQTEIANAAYAYQRAVDKREQVVVGVNAFQVQEQQHLERLKLDPAIEEQQRRRLAELRARRDNGKVAELRARLESAARGAENLMPLLVECVENNVTLGEICSTLRGVFGEYKPSAII
jgi:methylmalonyl-CoA mutase N-terminal domain/subunit